MSKWHINPICDSAIFDEGGRPIAMGLLGFAAQIVREHNSHAALIEMAELWANASQARIYIPDREKPSWDELMEKTRDALALAKGDQ